MYSTKKISNESELRFAAEFVRAGWEIFMPFSEDTPVDLLILKNGEFKRVQIKATKPVDGAIKCKLRSSNNWRIKKYSKEEIDTFGIYDYHNKKGYLISLKEVEGMGEICLRIDEPKNSQKKGIRLAKDYHFF